jgi:hypothetical protein
LNKLWDYLEEWSIFHRLGLLLLSLLLALKPALVR